MYVASKRLSSPIICNKMFEHYSALIKLQSVAERLSLQKSANGSFGVKSTWFHINGSERDGRENAPRPEGESWSDRWNWSVSGAGSRDAKRAEVKAAVEPEATDKDPGVYLSSLT